MTLYSGLAEGNKKAAFPGGFFIVALSHPCNKATHDKIGGEGEFEKSLRNRTANCPICLVCSNVWEINISTHI